MKFQGIHGMSFVELCAYNVQESFFIGNSIFNLSQELLTKFWETNLKVA